MQQSNKEMPGTPNEMSFSSIHSNSVEGIKIKLNGNINSNGSGSQVTATDPGHNRDRLSNIATAPGCELSSMSTPSKIPVLTSNLRQSKCASWAGVVTTTTHATQATSAQQQHDLQNSPQEILLDPIETLACAHHCVTGLQNSPNITDLTPGLFCFCMFVAP